MTKKLLKTLVAAVIFITSSAVAAPIEEATINQPGDANLVRGNLVVRDGIKVFGNEGLGLIQANGELADAKNLTTDGTQVLFDGQPLATTSNSTLNNPTINNPTITNGSASGTTITNPTITGGTVNGTVIGDQTPAAGNFTNINADNITATGSFNGALNGNATTASDLSIPGAAANSILFQSGPNTTELIPPPLIPNQFAPTVVPILGAIGGPGVGPTRFAWGRLTFTKKIQATKSFLCSAGVLLSNSGCIAGQIVTQNPSCDEVCQFLENGFCAYALNRCGGFFNSNSDNGCSFGNNSFNCGELTCGCVVPVFRN